LLPPLLLLPSFQAYTPQPCAAGDMTAFHSEDYLEALQSVNVKVGLLNFPDPLAASSRQGVFFLRGGCYK
jgi:hypothetical protein